MEANSTPLTSSELGNLWLDYQEKTMLLRFLEYLREHADDADIQSIIHSAYEATKSFIHEIAQIFQADGAVVPIGFTAEDVHPGVPKLFDYLYEPMFLHMISKIEVNLFALHFTMSYRKDIRQLYERLEASSQSIFNRCSQLLLDKGVLVRPPYMSMPKEVSFVKDDSYLTGFKWIGEKRALNAIEISLIHHAIETNLTGMQLMIGFAQVANDRDVKNYFIKGMELSKGIETTLGEFLRRDYIEPPATHAGKATNSTVAPFSDKLMMYLTNLLGAFGLGSNALGGAFSLRSDLPLAMAHTAQKILPFLKEGAELMIRHGWLEEPPQVEDRRKLTRS
ncbi:Protein of unknown function [Paenibacillus sp. UNCCL117]|nr:Protein of unknown function [Paenibacillus sp. cl123]SFW41357.1 Protein of unknown function [Paenibacillus sp. UNCCL117]